jgi:hypothetical protein
LSKARIFTSKELHLSKSSIDPRTPPPSAKPKPLAHCPSKIDTVKHQKDVYIQVDAQEEESTHIIEALKTEISSLKKENMLLKYKNSKLRLRFETEMSLKM